MTVLRDELQRSLGSAFTLERELEGAGMSTVFVARDNALDRRVAIKVLPYELAATVSVERFKREIMVSAALQHPHIVPVLSAGETDGLPFFIMPFVEGESLRARLARGPLSPREAVGILRDVARALAYAHGRGIVHRDIKPDNILLAGGSATVTDFGVAKALSASRDKQKAATATRSGTITLVGTSIGTPAYMAPEQAAGDPSTDHRADLYALGIVGYEMLLGAPPFHGLAPQQLLAAHLTEKPPSIGARRYDVPAALIALIDRLLEKDPAARPRTANELIRALDDPAMVSGAFPSPPAARTRRAYRVLWALAGAGILASFGAAGAWWSSRHGGPEPGAAVVGSKSIVVLPLLNAGRDTTDAYLAAGITSELTGALTRVPGLRVASAGGQPALAADTRTPAEIGRAMHVDMVLVGTMQRDRDRVRVSTLVVNSSDGVTISAGMAEHESKDLFKLQDEITASIVAEVAQQVQTAPAAKAPMLPDGKGTRDLDAYDLYLRGQYAFDKRGEASLRDALAFYERAVRRDSMFARAWAGIASAYALLPLYANVRPDSVMPLALAAINRSLAIDGTSATAFAARATLYQADWRWSDAEQDYKRAIALDPQLASAQQWYGELLLLTGRTDEGKAHLERATKLAPISAIAAGSYALGLAIGRAPDSAVATARHAVALDSALVAARFMLGAVELLTGHPADGLRELKTAYAMDSSSVQTAGLLGYADGKTGDRAAALQIANRLERDIGHRSGAASSAAHVYLGLGDNARALSLLESAAADHDAFFSSESLYESFFDPVRGDPRFIAIEQRVGLRAR